TRCSLIWLGKLALLWAREAKGMIFAASPLHFFFSVPFSHGHQMKKGTLEA
ncbi:unnamed protein product, partial [Ilex paraguariensis]